VPFTHQQFLDVFGAYNAAMWPAAVILWLASVTVMVAFYRRGATMTRPVMVLLAIGSVPTSVEIRVSASE
jgi:hypothetical protein